jgi:hypothetical protein
MWGGIEGAVHRCGWYISKLGWEEVAVGKRGYLCGGNTGITAVSGGVVSMAVEVEKSKMKKGLMAFRAALVCDW